MVGQEVGIYGVFIWITNEPCITWPSSLQILNTLGHFNFVLLLFLHKTISLRPKKGRVAVSILGVHHPSLGLMSPVEFKKWLCGPVNVRGLDEEWVGRWMRSG